MLRLFLRKFLLIILLIPVLNVLGYYFALTNPQAPFNQRRPGLPPPEPPLYADYLAGLGEGDLGRVGVIPMNDIVLPSLANSLVLLGVTLLIVAIVGPLLGFVAISRRNRRITTPALLVMTAGSSLPGFFLGVAVLAGMLYGVLSAVGGGGGTLLPLSGFGLDEHLILPVLVLAAGPTLQVARVTAGLLENELHQDYVRVARSKGLSWLALLRRHALPNIAAPVVVTIGRSLRLLISGLIVVEALFLWPGLGRLFTFAVGIRIDGREPPDYFMHPELLAALAVVFGVGLLVAELVASLTAQAVDPRLRLPVESA